MREILFSFLRGEKRLKAVWSIERDGKGGTLAGTAHFTPYRLGKSLERYIAPARTILLEGPLDEESMKEVLERGAQAGGAAAIFDALDPLTLGKIENLFVQPSDVTGPRSLLRSLVPQTRRVLSDLRNLRPWSAFFEIWTNFLKKNGWEFSVDLEALEIATRLKKKIVFLETIEEQVSAMERIPVERFVSFLEKIDEWKTYAEGHARRYLQGDLGAMLGVTSPFPSRCPSIVEERDPVMFERMKPFFERGQALALVGVSHLPGIQNRFRAEGFTVTQATGVR